MTEKSMFGIWIWICIVILCTIGWIINIFKFVAVAQSGEFDLIGIMHGVGIVFAPLGVIMGWFIW